MAHPKEPGLVLLPDSARRALGNLQFRPGVLAEGRVSGLHPSSHQGQSLEFSDLKGYASGDDPRGVDWKVYARTDKLYVRRYLDETNLEAHLVLDASGSMGHPAEGRSKLEHAASMLAGLAWVMLRQGDEVGVHVAHETDPVSTPPRAVASHLNEVLAALGAAEASRGTVLDRTLERVVGVAGRKGVVVLASDLLTGWEDALSALRLLAARGHAVVVLHVLSHEERTFPFRGTVLFRAAETGESALMDARGLRRHYLAAFQRFEFEVRTACHRAGVFFFPVDMRSAPHEGVAEVMRAVAAGRRTAAR
ncbi:MAG: DUF58 domain-containing protein [Deltaproteobacteria bacterium]|nr:DUF58 domain-containing protein [Deltaproteobacteria bacterium]